MFKSNNMESNSIKLKIKISSLSIELVSILTDGTDYFCREIFRLASQEELNHFFALLFASTGGMVTFQGISTEIV